MLWTTTHNTIQTVLRDGFPMADPACRPLNSAVERISGDLDKQEIERLQNSPSRPAAVPFCKTNSPAAPHNPGAASI